MVFIMKSLDIVFTFHSVDHEFIYFEIRLNKLLYSFVCAYRSEKFGKEGLLNAITEFILTRNMELPLFIIGDLNFDLSSHDGSSKILTSWMESLNLKNYVDKPTRNAKYRMKATNTVNYTSTLLDVVLHNKNLISSTS